MKKFFVLGLVAVMLSAGLLLVSCSKCPGGGNTSSKGDCNIAYDKTTGMPKGKQTTCSDSCQAKDIQKDIAAGKVKSAYKCSC